MDGLTGYVSSECQKKRTFRATASLTDEARQDSGIAGIKDNWQARKYSGRNDLSVTMYDMCDWRYYEGRAATFHRVVG